MTKFAVAYMNYFDNELEIKFVECEDILDAPVVAGFENEEGRSCWETVDQMEDYFFNSDAAICVKELP